MAPQVSGLDDLGLVLADGDRRIVYCNDAARKILSYPDGEGDAITALIERRGLLGALDGGHDAPDLRSGRRVYRCRAIQLDAIASPGPQVLTAFLLERRHRIVSRQHLSRSYRLTQRESQVTELLTLGLTNKQIAGRLGVTPNTTKTFLKLVMCKMSVTSRAGVISKLLHDRRA